MFMLKGKFGILEMKDGTPLKYSSERLARIGKRVMENHLNKDRAKGQPKKRVKIVEDRPMFQIVP